MCKCVLVFSMYQNNFKYTKRSLLRLPTKVLFHEPYLGVSKQAVLNFSNSYPIPSKMAMSHLSSVQTQLCTLPEELLLLELLRKK